MKFPRNARIFRGQLDAAPFATVFFLLVIFLMLGQLVYTPGVRLRLPIGDNLGGTDKATLPVAIDANGRYYFENQLIAENELRNRLSSAVKKSSEPLALLVQADERVPHEMVVRLTLLARDAGIREAWLAALPRPVIPAGSGND
jgi:biopolymer transport protein ExbD